MIGIEHIQRDRYAVAWQILHLPGTPSIGSGQENDLGVYSLPPTVSGSRTLEPVIGGIRTARAYSIPAITVKKLDIHHVHTRVDLGVLPRTSTVSRVVDTPIVCGYPPVILVDKIHLVHVYISEIREETLPRYAIISTAHEKPTGAHRSNRVAVPPITDLDPIHTLNGGPPWCRVAHPRNPRAPTIGGANKMAGVRACPYPPHKAIGSEEHIKLGLIMVRVLVLPRLESVNRVDDTPQVTNSPSLVIGDHENATHRAHFEFFARKRVHLLPRLPPICSP